MIILAIDPGPVESAMIEWDGETISNPKILSNYNLLSEELPQSFADIMVIEQIKSYGMTVADSIFDTVFWTGRFCQRWMRTWKRVPRKDVKMYLCGTMRAKDSNIRQCLIDRFGDPGTKKKPGLTYGLKADLWQAFALAVFWADNHQFSI